MMSWFCYDTNDEECHLSNRANYIYYHSMHFSSFSLAESPPRDLQIAASNNGLLMRNTV